MRRQLLQKLVATQLHIGNRGCACSSGVSDEFAVRVAVALVSTSMMEELNRNVDRETYILGSF
jgi:hypothetical protein